MDKKKERGRTLNFLFSKNSLYVQSNILCSTNRDFLNFAFTLSHHPSSIEQDSFLALFEGGQPTHPGTNIDTAGLLYSLADFLRESKKRRAAL